MSDSLSETYMIELVADFSSYSLESHLGFHLESTLHFPALGVNRAMLPVDHMKQFKQAWDMRVIGSLSRETAPPAFCMWNLFKTKICLRAVCLGLLMKGITPQELFQEVRDL